MTKLDDFFQSTNLNIMKSILTQIPTGFFICDIDGIVLYVNDIYAQYFNKSPDDFFGRKITDIFPDSGIPRVILSGRPVYGVMREIPGTSGKINITVSRIPLFDDNGKICGAMSIAIANAPEQIHNLTTQVDNKSPKYKTPMHKQHRHTATYSVQSILGESTCMHSVKTYLVKYAKTDAPVLILGETGTGKELTASAIHMASDRKQGPYVAINCSAYPKELFESELFGYAAGAFSGAHKNGKQGQIQLAHHGTLFLDEIGELPLDLQTKLLRVLEEKKITPLGATYPYYADFRLVAATNRDLKIMVSEGTFREDLLYRINPLVLHLPPLSERQEDIPLLTDKILGSITDCHTQYSKEVLQAFCLWSWPGNIRELRNVLVRAVTLCHNAYITLADIPQEMANNIHLPQQATGKLEQITKNSEATYILNTLTRNNWNVQKSAKDLGISRASLYEKMNKAHIKRPSI